VAILEIAAFGGGILLGLIHFWGLWWTTRRSMTVSNPTALILGSYLLRLLTMLLGIYWIMDGRWQRLVACFAGILIARLIVLRSARF